MKDGIRRKFRPQAETENLSFLRDMQDLFAQRRFAHVANWRFSEPLAANDPVRGNQLWNEMEQRAKSTGLYYIYSDEVELIEHCFGEIGRELPDNITLIDYGPGPEESIRGKIIPILERLGPKIKRYVGVDLVPAILKQAEDIFRKEYPDIEFIPLSQDFYKERLDLPQSGKRLSVIFGLTMFNIAVDPRIEGLPEKMLVNMLGNLGRNLRKGELLSVTQDLNRDQDLMKKLYGEQKDLWLNLLYRVQRDLKPHGDFDPEAFDYEVDWIPKTNASVRTFVVKKKMDFMLGDEPFSLKAGQRFFVHNAFKYVEADFINMARDAGLQKRHTVANDAGRMALHIFERR